MNQPSARQRKHAPTGRNDPRETGAIDAAVSRVNGRALTETVRSRDALRETAGWVSMVVIPAHAKTVNGCAPRPHAAHQFARRAVNEFPKTDAIYASAKMKHGSVASVRAMSPSVKTEKHSQWRVVAANAFVETIDGTAQTIVQMGVQMSVTRTMNFQQPKGKCVPVMRRVG